MSAPISVMADRNLIAPAADPGWLLGQVVKVILRDNPEDGSDAVYSTWGLVAVLIGLLGLAEGLAELTDLSALRIEERRRLAAWFADNRGRLAA